MAERYTVLDFWVHDDHLCNIFLEEMDKIEKREEEGLFLIVLIVYKRFQPVVEAPSFEWLPYNSIRRDGRDGPI